MGKTDVDAEKAWFSASDGVVAFVEKMRGLGVEKFRFGNLEVVFSPDHADPDTKPEASLEDMLRQVTDFSPDELEDIAARERGAASKEDIADFVSDNYRSSL